MYVDWIATGLKKPGKTKGGLAKALRLHQSQITRLLSKGGRRLRADELDRISEYLEEPVPTRTPLVNSYDPDAPATDETATDDRGAGVDVRQLWGPEAIPELVAEGGLGGGHVVKTVDAGDMNTVDEVKDDYWRFPAAFTRGVLGAAPIHMIAIECSGDSMEPTLASGDRVWVNTLHKRPTPDGLYALRDVFDAIVVKRLEVAQEHPLRLRIISDNPKHNPREVAHDEVRIIGKVVAGLKLF